MLQYVTTHDELYRKISEHSITLPVAVQGWHLLRRAGLNKEKTKIQEALFLLFGQDFKAGGHTSDRRPTTREDYEATEYMSTREEYDEAFAAYVDACRRFNDITLSRGFLPIVCGPLRPRCWKCNPRSWHFIFYLFERSCKRAEGQERKGTWRCKLASTPTPAFAVERMDIVLLSAL